MKTNSMIRTVMGVMFVIGLTQCGGAQKEDMQTAEESVSETTAAEETAAPQFIVDNAFKEQLSRVFASYIKVKNGFVESDAAKVSAEASTLKKILRAMDAGMLSGAALNDWSNYSGNLDTELAEIIGSSDIEAQRTAFSALTDNLYKSIKAYGLEAGTAYYDFCPMAFNNQGAFWLSDTKEIRNPYFGDKMLTCGSVTETLQ